MIITPDMVGKELYLVVEDTGDAYLTTVYAGKPGMPSLSKGQKRADYMKRNGWSYYLNPENGDGVFVDPSDGSWWDAGSFDDLVWEEIQAKWQLQPCDARITDWNDSGWPDDFLGES